MGTSSSSSSTVLMDHPTHPQKVSSDIAVHLAARFQAPLRIIYLLSRAYPHSLSSTDVTGRYPIHVAAKWGATPDVIAYLIKTNPSVAGVPDSTGKTPMHYVGEYYLQNFNSSLHGCDDSMLKVVPLLKKSFKSSLYGCDDSMLKVVRLLKKAAPMSVNLEDDEGMNAIEYALVNDANLEVIKSMQRACRDDWRERSKGGSPADCGSSDAPQSLQLGRRRHQELVRDMETMALKLQSEYTSNEGIDKKLSNERIHVHSSRTSEANTHAARMA